MTWLKIPGVEILPMPVNAIEIRAPHLEPDPEYTEHPVKTIAAYSNSELAALIREKVKNARVVFLGDVQQRQVKWPWWLRWRKERTLFYCYIAIIHRTLAEWNREVLVPHYVEPIRESLERPPFL